MQTDHSEGDSMSEGIQKLIEACAENLDTIRKGRQVILGAGIAKCFMAEVCAIALIIEQVTYGKLHSWDAAIGVMFLFCIGGAIQTGIHYRRLLRAQEKWEAFMAAACRPVISIIALEHYSEQANASVAMPPFSGQMKGFEV